MRKSIRCMCCLLAAFALYLSACGSKEGLAPPQQDHSLLIGKWDRDESFPDQFVQGYEFGTDKTVRIKIWRMTNEIPGTYSWSDNTTLTIEYHPTEAAKKEYQKTLAEYREWIKEQSEKANPQYRERIADSGKNYPDELPAKEDLRAGLSDRERQGAILTVATNTGVNYSFKKSKEAGSK